MQRTAWWIGGSSESATILGTVNESEGQLSCLHGQPHLIWPPHTFSTSSPFLFILRRGWVDHIWWWQCMMVKYFRTPLKFKLYSACRHTCIQVSWPNPCRTGCRLPQVSLLLSLIYPIIPKCVKVFMMQQMYLKLGGNICNWDDCVSNPHEGRFLLDTSISSPPSPAPQTSQLLTSPSNTAQKPSHPKTPSQNILVQNAISCGSYQTLRSIFVNACSFQGLSRSG